MPPGTEWGLPVYGAFLNDAGQVALSAEVSGAEPGHAPRDVIYAGTPGDLEIIALAGTQAPGFSDGVRFGGFGDPILNARGQVAFWGGVYSETDPQIGSSGVWATDLDGFLIPVLLKGHLLEVAAGDVREILFVVADGGFGDGSDGHGTSFNANGELALSVYFTDGTQGLFIATVPEPGSAILLLLAALGARGVRRPGIVKPRSM